jgi:phage-related protein
LSFAPSKWISPPLEWSLGIGVSLLMFGVVAALLGKIVQMAGGPINFLIGALALVVLAGVILAISYIMMALPESLFKKNGLLYNVADTMEYFGFKMVNVFVYLVKELMPYVKEFITFMANLFVDIFPKIVDPLNRFIDALAVSFGNLLDHVVPLITAAFNGIATVLSAASSIIVPIINAIKDVILGVLDFIIKGFQEFKTFINDLATIGAANILAIGGALFSLAGGLAAVMAVMAGGAIAQGVGKAVEGLGNLVGGIASGIGNFFSGEEAPKEAKMDPMQFISFVATNIGVLEKAATALEKIAKSLSSIMVLKPTEGLMKFLGVFTNYVKVISGGGLFGGPVNAIVKANNSFVGLFKEMQKVDDMKLMKVNDILENTANLMRLDKGDGIEVALEAVTKFIKEAVDVVAKNSEAVATVSKGTEVSQSELKLMIEQMKLAVEKMGSQNIGADIKAALAGATLGVRVTNFPTIYPNR